MMKRVLFTALLFGAAPAAAQAQTAVGATPPAQTNTADRVICEKVEETGTRLGAKRVCMTQRQWEERRRQIREDVEETRRRGRNG